MEGRAPFSETIRVCMSNTWHNVVAERKALFTPAPAGRAQAALDPPQAGMAVPQTAIPPLLSASSGHHQLLLDTGLTYVQVDPAFLQGNADTQPSEILTQKTSTQRRWRKLLLLL